MLLKVSPKPVMRLIIGLKIIAFYVMPEGFNKVLFIVKQFCNSFKFNNTTERRRIEKIKLC